MTTICVYMYEYQWSNGLYATLQCMRVCTRACVRVYAQEIVKNEGLLRTASRPSGVNRPFKTVSTESQTAQTKQGFQKKKFRKPSPLLPVAYGESCRVHSQAEPAHHNLIHKARLKASVTQLKMPNFCHFLNFFLWPLRREFTQSCVEIKGLGLLRKMW
jgi:hypothetical protein